MESPIAVHPVSPAPEPTRPESASTPGRDPAIDLYRAGALMVVVLGHWLLAVVHWQEGTLDAANLLNEEPATQWATWLLQPMPLFFVVGGWAAAASLANADRRTSTTEWVSARMTRLLVPTTTYASAALVLFVALRSVLGDTAEPAGRLLGMHLWFLAVFVPATALAPLLAHLVQRHGWRVPMMLGAATIAVDLARFVAGVPGIGWVNFAFVWLLFMAIGMAAHQRAPRQIDAVRVGVVAFTLLCTVVALGWYSHSMVGVGDRSNNTPPTVALALLGIAQAAGAALLAPWLREAHTRRRRLRSGAGLLGATGMHLYLWHLVAVLALVGLIGATGVGNVEPLGVAWLISRPLWLVALIIVTAPVVVAALSWDLRQLGGRTAPTTPSPFRVTLAVAVASPALAMISLFGFGSGLMALGAVAALFAAVRLARGPSIRTRR